MCPWKTSDGPTFGYLLCWRPQPRCGSCPANHCSGSIDLSRWLGLEWFDSFGWGEEMFASLAGQVGLAAGLHWVIAGGESGPGARPMHPNWARTLRDQCQAASVPFLFKQWGMWRPASIHDRPARPAAYRELRPGRQPVVRVGKHAAGRVLDGRTWDEFPATAVPG